MLPLAVGMSSGTLNTYGIIGFLLTAVLLPLVGITAMVLYNGNYEQFFKRLGDRTGETITFVCLLIIGPVIAMPRIVTLSHTMISPFMPAFLQDYNSFGAALMFALLFLGLTFLLTYRESKIVDILGYVVSPLLLVSLSFIIIKGMICAHDPMLPTQNACSVFFTNLLRGYETLDLLGALFFSSIVLIILRSNPANKNKTEAQLALTGFQGGLIGISLLAIIYVGMSILGVYYGHGFENLNSGELFREISMRILGNHGALVIATAVLMACLSTAIALAAVVAEYVQHTLFKKRISYINALLITLASCIPISTAGLGYVLKLTGGAITFVGYPTLIVLTLANAAHKLFGVNMVRIPVYLTFVTTLFLYFWK